MYASRSIWSRLRILPSDKILSFDEIERLVKSLFHWALKIRITGGEPLLRRDLPELIARIHRIKGVEDIALTTNGSLLKNTHTHWHRQA